MSVTATEMMVIAAAREVMEGEVLFVGMRLPLLAFALAKALHAPNAVGLFECGIVRDEVARAPLRTMTDPPNILGASWAGSMAEVLGLLAQGHVHLGMLGGAQVDRYGNLNTTYIGGYIVPEVRLPGSGGASDIASLAQRFMVLMPHEARRFVDQVDYITSPGYGIGPWWREGVGLPGRSGAHPHGGPDVVISTLGVLGFDEGGEMVLLSLHPGATLEAVQANTGWPLKISPTLAETPPPSEEELATLRRLDPERVWTGSA